jgi:phosphatidylserine/phosphatidylglycerophosphate/cardiolipin synthase-like enzyme
MVEHYSNKIQNVIQKELFNAKQSIKIVVAWFTNDLLFLPLVLKQQAGVKVEIILNRDEINDSDDNNIDFCELINVGGVVRWNETKQLMHDKFCVIDDSIVIYGSYNWTNKAEYNEESIAVSRNESETIKFYLDKFRKLAEKYPAVISSSPNLKITSTNPSNSATPIDILTLEKERSKQPYIWRECKCVKFSPYNALSFYDKIEVVSLALTKDIFIAKMKGSYYFIQPLKWTPYNDVEFSEYIRNDQMVEGTIWLKVAMKWGLYVPAIRKFAFEPICDEIKNCNGNIAFRIGIKWGMVDKYNHIILDCKYDNIFYLGKGVYRLRCDGIDSIIKESDIHS